MINQVLSASDGSAYKAYALTQKGREVFPIVVSLHQWGERHLFKAGESHSVLLDKAHDEPIATLEVRSADGRKLEPGDCHCRRVTQP